jgi:hypothetical protein
MCVSAGGVWEGVVVGSLWWVSGGRSEVGRHVVRVWTTGGLKVQVVFGYCTVLCDV